MKKLLCVTLVTILALVFAGCDNAYGITTIPTEPTRPVETTPVQTTPAPTTPAQTTPTPTTPPTTPAPTEPTTAEPVDEFAALRISESEAKSKGGTFLKRDNKLYEFNGPWFYMVSNIRDSFSLGEVPVLTITATDQVIGYFSSGNGEIRLTKMNFIGYTIPIYTVSKMDMEVKQMNGITTIRVEDLSQINILDKNGRPVSAEDARNLNYGEEYTVYWYTGSQYNEIKMVANCNYYCKDSSFKAIKIAAELTKDGYAIYDLSGVPAGTYEAPDGGIVRIE